MTKLCLAFVSICCLALQDDVTWLRGSAATALSHLAMHGYSQTAIGQEPGALEGLVQLLHNRSESYRIFHVILSQFKSYGIACCVMSFSGVFCQMYLSAGLDVCPDFLGIVS